MEEIKIIPSVIEFKDVDTGCSGKIRVKVINIGKTSKLIRFVRLQSEYFRLKYDNHDEAVAPGLSVAALVTYDAISDVEKSEEFILTVDGVAVKVPIKAYPRRPILSTDSHIEFGYIVVGNCVVTRQLYIYNQGSKDGDFALTYTGKSPITLYPTSGRIKRQSAQVVKVEVLAEKPGRFDEIISVQLEGNEPSAIHVYGHVVKSSLQLLGFQSDGLLDCIRFGTTYYGSDTTQSAILYNNGPEVVRYLIVLNDCAEGQLAGQTVDGQGHSNDVTSMVTVLPTQGCLQPYEKIPVYFKFSPRWEVASRGFKTTQKVAPCQDISIFIQVLRVGTDQLGDSGKNRDGCSAIEIGLTALAVPVHISFTAPASCTAVHDSRLVDFGQCKVGGHIGLTLTLANNSPALPVVFQFRRLAHFSIQPYQGHLKPGQSCEVVATFAPNQLGTFCVEQHVDILGQVANDFNPFSLNLEVIYSTSIKLRGCSSAVTSKKDPVFVMGITPKITSEVATYFGEKSYDVSVLPRNARLNAHRLKSIKDKKNQSFSDALIALPNDRAQSIAPGDRYRTFKTIFAGIVRHNYVDPDYAYTDDQMQANKNHKQYYIDFIEALIDKRRNKRSTKQHKRFDTSTDISLKPAAGIKPIALRLADQFAESETTEGKSGLPNCPKLLTTTELLQKEAKSSKQVRDGLNAIPTSSVEKADCQKVLSPVELHQITIGPSTVNFGRVCCKSTTQKDVNIVNNLDQYIHVVISIDCKELRQTSPLSHVIPPSSRVIIPVIFESNTKGRFQRSIIYKINGFYQNYFTVFADVVNVHLDLSSDSLQLESSPGVSPESSVRSCVTLFNRLNLATDFTWNPILGDKGTAFSIRPASGTVEASSALTCEVVFHPSFFAPTEGEFALQVHGGTTQRLRCYAKLGIPNVQMVDRRVSFGQVPLHLTSWRMAALKNNGNNHAYFQVLNPSPFPGLSLSPICGAVPVGGVAFICATLTSDSIIKFDTEVDIAIRNGKNIDMRIGGTVEPPSVDIDISKFDFGGVYCGEKSVMPFTLSNRGNTRARIEFDLTRCRDFHLDFGDKQTTDDVTFERLNPGLFTVGINSCEQFPCQMIFTPTEVASYDFVMNVTVNETLAPTPAPTPLPPGPLPCRSRHIISPRPQDWEVITPRRKIVATAKRQPLQLSCVKVDFSISMGMIELATGIGQCKNLILANVSDQPIQWSLNTDSPSVIEGYFRFVQPTGTPFVTGANEICGSLLAGETETICVQFVPGQPGKYEASVPLILNGETSHPYQLLTLEGRLRAPTLEFDPPVVIFSAVPLAVEVSTEVLIRPRDFHRTVTLVAETCCVECEDGGKITPLSVSFIPDSGPASPSAVIEAFPLIHDDSEDSAECSSALATMRCRIVFKSPKPVSFSQHIIFCDSLGNTFSLPVIATADNCILTCYPYLSRHSEGHQIACARGRSLLGHVSHSQEGSSVGEAQLLTGDVLSGSRPTSTVMSSTFGETSSSYDSSSMYNSTDGTTPQENTPAQRSNSVDKLNYETGKDFSTEQSQVKVRSLLPYLFPEDESDEGQYYADVLNGVQRWFSNNGWSGAIYPVVIPDSLRGGLTKRLTEEKSKNGKFASASSAVEKVTQTVYDMLTHLSGKVLLGINTSCALPADPNIRAEQVYAQHCTLLSFVRSQGGCVVSIKPEYLMEPRDYRQWMKLHGSDVESAVDDVLFDSLSKRAWMDLLLQILKTLVLAKITPRQFKNAPTPFKTIPLPTVDGNPLCSNVYSLGERIILAWMNQHYEQMRHTVWGDPSVKGGVPPSRWIVNFDFNLLDSLVLAAVLASYAPYLIRSHFLNMYTRPLSAEQCLHNALCVVSAMRSIGIDYDIQAIDLTDPNPICLLLLCVHLYFNLPHYLPKNMVEFEGGLHETVSRQVKLSNPGSKPTVYCGLLCGRDAQDFSICNGPMVTIPPRSSAVVTLTFNSKFMRPSEAVLVLAGRRHGATVGCTLAFSLSASVNKLTPLGELHCQSPCYVERQIQIAVTNHLPQNGNFQILLVEINGEFPGSAQTAGKLTSKTLPMAGSNLAEQQSDETQLRAFFSSTHSIQIAAAATEFITVSFLAFSPGQRQCAVILTDDSVGELLYLITATGLLPLPEGQTVDHSKPSESVEQHNFIEWLSDVGDVLSENIQIPIKNAAKEHALAVAAKLMMSEKELHRHILSGTLTSASVMAKTIELLSKLPSAQSSNISRFVDTSKARPNLALYDKTHQERSSNCIYTVCVDNDKHFTPIKQSVIIPDFLSVGVCSPALNECVQLPIKFHADEAGQYTTLVTLRHGGIIGSNGTVSGGDVRVFCVRCTVRARGRRAHIDFVSPVNQPVLQNIPIVNTTSLDWLLSSHVQGLGFTGPRSLNAPAGTVTQYPLQFLPRYEGIVPGKLTLVNSSDGVEHVFTLQGKGDQPLPLDTLSLQLKVKQSIQQVLSVPNMTKRTLKLKVESDIGFLSGADSLLVLAGKTGYYDLSVRPLKRGSYDGVLAFRAVSDAPGEVDSDGDSVVGDDSSEPPVDGYYLWYAVSINVTPGEPTSTISVTCPCQQSVIVEVQVNNPTNAEMILDVDLSGHGLEGPSQITLPPGARQLYQATFAPSIIGVHSGCLSIYNELVGEVWYHLELTAEHPVPTALPYMECELGSFAQQIITLQNYSADVVHLHPHISNPNNFVLELDATSPLTLTAHGRLELPLTFVPSKLGVDDQIATITFQSVQLGDWVFTVCGKGLIPRLQETLSITAILCDHSSMLIPFRNPTDVHVLVDIHLREGSNRHFGRAQSAGQEKALPFCLLLKTQHGIPLAPKGTLQIPVSFLPQEMSTYQAQIDVVVRREDGQCWNTGGENNQTGLKELSWVYPITGLTEVAPPKNTPPVLFETRARQRIEQQFDVVLSGVVTSGMAPKQMTRSRSDFTGLSTDGVLVGETITVSDVYRYDLVFANDDVRKDVEPSAAVQLIHQNRDPDTGLAHLTFNVVYAPSKVMTHNVVLGVQSASGGRWSFPLKFVSREPETEDKIIIEAVGLNKMSTVSFHLCSPHENSVPYTASFVSERDSAEFSVYPQTGVLPPANSDSGAMITIGFSPTIYGRIFRTKLLIQSTDMHWTYEIHGVLPAYNAPVRADLKCYRQCSVEPRLHRKPVNYLQDNLRLTTTAVSSPVKGSRLTCISRFT